LCFADLTDVNFALKLGNNIDDFWKNDLNGIERNTKGPLPPDLFMKSQTTLQNWKDNPTLIHFRVLTMSEKKRLSSSSMLFGYLDKALVNDHLSSIHVVFVNATIPACEESLTEGKAKFVVDAITGEHKFRSKPANQKELRKFLLRVFGIGITSACPNPPHHILERNKVIENLVTFNLQSITTRSLSSEHFCSGCISIELILSLNALKIVDLDGLLNDLVVKRQPGRPSKSTATAKHLETTKNHANAAELLKNHFTEEKHKNLWATLGCKLLRTHDNKITPCRIKCACVENDKIAGVVTDYPDHLDASNNPWEEKLEWSEFCKSVIETHNSGSFKPHFTHLSTKEGNLARESLGNDFSIRKRFCHCGKSFVNLFWMQSDKE